MNDMISKIDICSLDKAEITEVLNGIGEKSFRAEQIFEALHRHNVKSFDDITTLSKELRKKLSEISYISKATLITKQKSMTDNTIKYLFEINNSSVSSSNDGVIEDAGENGLTGKIIEDKIYLECVLMRYSFGNSICVSSQAGCRMGCVFCASAINGLSRNLTASEILKQVYDVSSDIGERISNVVIMGMGEPLDNYDNVLKFIRLLNMESGYNIGWRHITLSTCGLVDKIKALAEEKMQINLAVSLHAPDDKIRREIMPVAKANPYNDLIDICRYYTEKTKRRITFEYALMSGINDRPHHADKLADKLRGMLCHVNLIPMNGVNESNYKRSSENDIKKFCEVLTNRKITTTIRRELGSDINAACGQLRNGMM